MHDIGYFIGRKYGDPIYYYYLTCNFINFSNLSLLALPCSTSILNLDTSSSNCPI
jgi:hypothetical protein